jgi:hypothetical protein
LCLNLLLFLVVRIFFDWASLDLFENALGGSEQHGTHAFVVTVLLETPFGFFDSFLGMEQAIVETVCENLCQSQPSASLQVSAGALTMWA